MKFRTGLWYQCLGRVSHWQKGYWYYCPQDGLLKGHDDKPHRVCGFHYRHFTDGQEIRIRAPK